MAALAAIQAGAQVRIYERSAFPRHKVCGEFLSPEILPVFERLGLLSRFQSLRPASIRRTILHFGAAGKTFLLPEPAFGLSRHAFDDFLSAAMVERGAGLVRELRLDQSPPVIVAHGRRFVPDPPERGARLFGFKTHFSGPSNDAVELFFFDGG